MPFSSTNPPIAIQDNGLTGSMVWRYFSTDVSSDVEWWPTSTDPFPAGYFRGCGLGGRFAVAGMKVGDPVLILASPAAVIPGQATWFTCIRSTPDQSSTVAASGWGANYDISVGGLLNSTMFTSIY